MSAATLFAIPAVSYQLLYVRDVAVSEKFYQDLLQRRPIESSPGFALFLLSDNFKLGLWKKDAVLPAATDAGGSEIGIALNSQAEVDACYASWQAAGISIVQTPCQLDFGYTFVACDPDGHRLRVFVLSM